jgi:hypothetical protein
VCDGLTIIKNAPDGPPLVGCRELIDVRARASAEVVSCYLLGEFRHFWLACHYN